jgi:hypothetical protein
VPAFWAQEGLRGLSFRLGPLAFALCAGRVSVFRTAWARAQVLEAAPGPQTPEDQYRHDVARRARPRSRRFE